MGESIKLSTENEENLMVGSSLLDFIYNSSKTSENSTVRIMGMDKVLDCSINKVKYLD